MPAVISLIRYGFPSLFSQFGHGPIISFLINSMFSIALHTVALLIGLYCAISIGARLLLLDDQYRHNVWKDILKPAVLWGLISVCITLMPTYFWYKSLNTPIDKIFEFFINKLFSTLQMDLLMLLFGVCGITFILRKIAKNTLVSTLMPISIAFITIIPYVPVLFDSIYRPLYSHSNIIAMLVFTSAQWLIIAGLFWRKGLEAALVCEVFVVTVLHLILPLIIFVLST